MSSDARLHQRALASRQARDVAALPALDRGKEVDVAGGSQGTHHANENGRTRVDLTAAVGAT